MPTAGHKLRLRRDFVTRLRSNRVLDGAQLRRHGGTRWVKTGRLRGLTFAVGVLKRGGKFYGTDREGWWNSGMREVYRLRQAIAALPVGQTRFGDLPGATAGAWVEGASALAQGQAAGPSGLGVGGLWAHRVSARAAEVEFLPMPTETHRR